MRVRNTTPRHYRYLCYLQKTRKVGYPAVGCLANRLSRIVQKDSRIFIKKKFDFAPFLSYIVCMDKIKKIEKLQNDLAWWQDKLNRSRKESLRSIRDAHVQYLRGEIQKLEKNMK